MPTVSLRGLRQRSTPISRYILSETQRTFDSEAKLWAYLDYWYIWIKPQHIPAAIDLASSAPHHQPGTTAHQDPNMDSHM